MDENKDIDLVSMTIIANSGDARSFAFQALASARKGEFDKAEELMKRSSIKLSTSSANGFAY